MHALIPLMVLLGPPVTAATAPDGHASLLRTLPAEQRLASIGAWLDTIAVQVAAQAVPTEAIAPPLPVIRHYAWDGQALHDEGVLRAQAQFIQRPFIPGESSIVLLTPDPD